MSTTGALDTMDIGTFKATIAADGDALEIVCGGEGDVAALPTLEAILKDAHARALAAKAASVVLDLRTVSFMNSSCFTKLIGWVTRVRELPSEGQYKIRIRSNQELLWQRRSLHALQCFAVDLITIEK